MPCYDPQVDELRHQTTRAACEMAKKLTRWQKEELSKETKDWITQHQEWDRRREKSGSDLHVY